ncbi:unannotated protein [freshwater metagenome]|uniref:Unannotated protein n=1 Tax=freshwater metagenome TaxID=449393 RepID=A0A6J6QJT0_9ZZZZ
MRYQEVPLRSVFSAPPAEGSKTRTAVALVMVLAITLREAREPVSSSLVSKIPTDPTLAPSSISSETAAKACTMPAFISKTPGPVS